MRGGLERWKRGADSRGVPAAIAYALDGECDAAKRTSRGMDALADYSEAASRTITRYAVEAGVILTDQLSRDQLRVWVDGRDPLTREQRGRDLTLPSSDLVLDGTINAPKSFSIVALLHPELAREFEALQDRLRDRVVRIWQRELNARRGAGGKFREALHRIEVVELQHRRSRALDPHIHRHLWLSVKVLGNDGDWSNVDSRVAMKLHTLINAEGDLAARTDPEWIAALARCGYTLNSNGEVAEVSHAVRPLSRRSNQIEANRAVMLAEWRDAHAGQEPDPDTLQQIDRRAWATGRPRKPKALEEDAWEQLILEELAAIDPALVDVRPETRPLARSIEDLDSDLLAARTIVDADSRATASGGRFSMFDIRAGATRAVAASGVVAPRHDLQSVIDDIVLRAVGEKIDLLDEERNRPQHIKGFMALSTVALKVALAENFDRLNVAGAPLSEDAMRLVADDALDGAVRLDHDQARAAGAIAGTDRLVAITGPAGTGKTTMLRVAKAALELQRRRLIIVAPTKKAASVAANEVGATASSLHALLADHGWRWYRDDAGDERWARLRLGDTDPQTGRIYQGPMLYPIAGEDRVVVDEAGMVDLYAANALAMLAAETGAGIAMVGDHLQARPVGHSGAMACMTRRSGAVVELTNMHRFEDPHFAELTLRLREPGSRDAAREVAVELAQRGLISRVEDLGSARELMVAAYFRWAAERRRVALVTSTNDEADAINDAIQQRRLELGEVSLHRIAIGRNDQRILEGDVVQTRRNDRRAGVDNRALWVVKHISGDVELASLADRTDVRRVTVAYVSEHLHLAYASTVHGIQGETTHASVVGPGVDASGLYVGMTRGRARNEAIVIAPTDESAKDAVATAMMRGLPEVTIDDARCSAQVELSCAARDDNTGAPTLRARWDDPRRRPFGAVDQLNSLIYALTTQLDELCTNERRLTEWIQSTSDVIRETWQRSTEADAGSHARHSEIDESCAGVYMSAVDELLPQRAAELELIAREVRETQFRLECAKLERTLRERLSEGVIRCENLEREMGGSRTLARTRAVASP